MMALTFLYPWLLSGLLLIPFIWLLLRVTPPAAKRIILPSLRFLHDLDQKNPPAHKTPWWLLLLRLLLLAFLIIGLARPVLNAQENLGGSGSIALILDNGWAASQTWQEQQAAALKIAEQAKRENRPLHLILTAPLTGTDIPQNFPAAAPDQIISQIKGLSPSSWPGQPGKTADLLSKDQEAYWISSGLAEQGYQDLLNQSSSLKVFIPQETRLPMLLRGSSARNASSIGQVEALMGTSRALAQVRALNHSGKLIDQVPVSVTGGEGYIDAISSLSPDMLKDIKRVELANRNGAGAVMLRDHAMSNNLIGLVSAESDKDKYNLTSPAYYISRAIEPFATFSTGNIENLLKEKPGIIVLAEGGSLPLQTIEQLTKWVQDGGILLRFATSSMIDEPDALLPVPLRRSERSLQGDLTWDNPLTIKSFSASSPFVQLALPTNIRIARQLLAEPTQDIGDKTWVTLSDNTPLITAKYEGKGLLILVHTMATPDWSDLPLSGFYVEIFKSLINLTARSDKQVNESGFLKPLSVLNGYGQLIQPPPTLKPIDRKSFSTVMPSALTPPGLYGSKEESLSLNLGDRLAPLESLASHLTAGNRLSADKAEWQGAPFFLGASLALFIIDFIALLVISGLILKLRWLLPVALLILPYTANATENDAEMAGKIHLAYIRTGDAALDQTSQTGLENLTRDLIDRTATEPGDVKSITLGQDDLVFYPFIYWPISPLQQDLSPAALSNIQNYIDHGGTIILDTRDGTYTPDDFTVSAQIEKLRALLKGTSLNPLIKAPESHVFFKTFYLLNINPDTTLEGDIWVEENSIADSAEVSSVILTGQDWARIWAAPTGTIPYLEKEQASRFGINSAMYALTGNYKSDQVHMKSILEKLGE